MLGGDLSITTSELAKGVGKDTKKPFLLQDPTLVPVSSALIVPRYLISPEVFDPVPRLSRPLGQDQQPQRLEHLPLALRGLTVADRSQLDQNQPNHPPRYYLLPSYNSPSSSSTWQPRIQPITPIADELSFLSPERQQELDEFWEIANTENAVPGGSNSSPSPAFPPSMAMAQYSQAQETFPGSACLRIQQSNQPISPQPLQPYETNPIQLSINSPIDPCYPQSTHVPYPSDHFGYYDSRFSPLAHVTASVNVSSNPPAPFIDSTPQTLWNDSETSWESGSKDTRYGHAPQTSKTPRRKRSDQSGSGRPYPRPRRSDDWPVNPGVAPTPLPVDPFVPYSPTKPKRKRRASYAPAPAAPPLSPSMESPLSGQSVIDFSQSEEVSGSSFPRMRSWQDKPWAASVLLTRTEHPLYAKIPPAAAATNSPPSLA
ncbi:hypothetical protein FRB94_011707 [Tulasnella sp. JGI-2019a]|nr:hypothetical protein FRB94_011707 [Tulasnella sp. JGI-2019a]